MRRGGSYYTPSSEPLKVLLETRFPEATWVVLWSGAIGLVVEGQSYARPGLYYLASLGTRVSKGGRPDWVAALRWRPEGARGEAVWGPKERGVSPIAALELLYPGTAWVDALTAPSPVPCSSCGAPVLWLTTTKGKPMPVDPALLLVVPGDASPPRATVVTPGGEVVTGRLVEREPAGAVAVAGRPSHFATCPDAAAHRRRTGGA